MLRAIREDEDAARALGKNAFSYKLQSLAIAAVLGAVSGWFLAINLESVTQDSFEPLYTFLGFAILDPGRAGELLGRDGRARSSSGRCSRACASSDLPLSADKVAALRFMLVGLVLILLMAFRPQGVFGKKEEMVLGE